MNNLIGPCEVAVKTVLPAMRALIAKELLETNGMNQEQVAEILGVSQSAVSKYARKIRGYVIKIEDIEEIQSSIETIVTLLIKEKSKRTRVLKLFCQTCKIIRKKGLMCQFCQKTDPSYLECNFCQNPNSKRW